MTDLAEIKAGHTPWTSGDDLCLSAWKEKDWLIAEVERLMAALKTVRRHEGGGPSEGLLHGDWSAICAALRSTGDSDE